MVDNQKPTISLQEGLSGEHAPGFIPIKGTILDENIEDVEVFYKDLEDQEYTLLFKSSEVTYENERISDLDARILEGNYGIKVVATDKAGNENSVVIEPIKILGEEQELFQFLSDPIQLSEDGPVYYHLGKDASVLFELKQDDNVIFTRSSALSAGIHSLEVNFEDYFDAKGIDETLLVLNTTVTTYKDDVQSTWRDLFRPILADNSGPRLENISLSQKFSGNADLILTGTIKDNNFHSYSLAFLENNGDLKPFYQSTDILDGTVHFSPDQFNDGEVIFIAKDSFGNESRQSLSVDLKNDIPTLQLLKKPKYVSDNIQFELYTENIKFGALIVELGKNIKPFLASYVSSNFVQDGFQTINIDTAFMKEDGRYTFRILTADGVLAETGTIILDRIAPFVALEVVDHGKTFEIIGSTTDLNFHEAQLNTKEDNQQKISTLINLSKPFENNSIITLPRKDFTGQREFRLVASDLAGNRTTFTVETRFINKTISILRPKVGVKVKNNLDLQFRTTGFKPTDNYKVVLKGDTSQIVADTELLTSTVNLNLDLATVEDGEYQLFVEIWEGPSKALTSQPLNIELDNEVSLQVEINENNFRQSDFENSSLQLVYSSTEDIYLGSTELAQLFEYPYVY